MFFHTYVSKVCILEAGGCLAVFLLCILWSIIVFLYRIFEGCQTVTSQGKRSKKIIKLYNLWPRPNPRIVYWLPWGRGAFPLRSAHKWPQRKSFYDLSDQSLHNADHLLLDKLWLFYTGPQHISQDKCGPAEPISSQWLKQHDAGRHVVRPACKASSHKQTNPTTNIQRHIWSAQPNPSLGLT